MLVFIIFQVSRNYPDVRFIITLSPTLLLYTIKKKKDVTFISMKRFLLITSYIFLLSSYIFAQQKTTGFGGKVVDAQTGEALPFVQVGFVGTTIGTTSDLAGKFFISNTTGHDSVRLQMMGYQPLVLGIKAGTVKRNAKVELVPKSNVMKTVEIKASKKKRKRYRRRNNPAVELAERVIENKSQNRIQSLNQFHRRAYEKTIIALDNFYPDFENKALWRKFRFLENYIDETPFDATPILTVSIREKMMEQSHRIKPKQDRTLITAKRAEGLDQALDVEGIEQSLNSMFAPIDIYDNDIELMLNHFTSPLNSTIGITFYRFFITDTVTMPIGTDSTLVKCVELSFVPSNVHSYGFTGQMYIALDSGIAVGNSSVREEHSYAVVAYNMTVSKNVNLNFVRDLTIVQSYRPATDNDSIFKKPNNTTEQQTNNSTTAIYVPNRCDAYGRMYIHRKLQEMYVHQVRIYFSHDFTPNAEMLPDSLFPRFVHTASLARTKWMRSQWNRERPITLTTKETLTDSLRYELARFPEFQFAKKAANLYLVGYIPTSTVKGESKFDIGPIFNFLSYNHEEGWRVRFGGMTTAALNTRNFLEGYVAYGFRDQRPKFNTTYKHSFNDKNKHSYDGRLNQLSLIASYELEAPGQGLGKYTRDNIWSSNDRPHNVQYVLQSVIRYSRQWRNNITFDTWVAAKQYELAGTLNYEQYQEDGSLKDLRNFSEAEWKGSISFRPDLSPENRRPGNAGSFSLLRDAPSISITHRIAILDCGLRYQRTDFLSDKRLWLGSFGHIDTRLQSGLVWGRAPYTRLTFPPANDGLYVSENAFNTMRPMEFVVDQYVSFFASYHLKGWILNWIPLINRLRLREIVGFNMIYGGLSARNNPNLPDDPAVHNAGLFRMPDGVNTLGKTPYMEFNIGIENILKFIRIDYFRRITYNDGMDWKQKSFIKIDFKFTL